MHDSCKTVDYQVKGLLVRNLKEICSLRRDNKKRPNVTLNASHSWLLTYETQNGEFMCF